MKRKNKSWWEVTTRRAGLAYSERKWLTYEECTKSSCSHARFNTKKRAFKNAIGLTQKTDREVVVLHWYYYKGKRRIREWVARAAYEAGVMDTLKAYTQKEKPE